MQDYIYRMTLKAIFASKHHGFTIRKPDVSIDVNA